MVVLDHLPFLLMTIS